MWHLQTDKLRPAGFHSPPKSCCFSVRCISGLVKFKQEVVFMLCPFIFYFSFFFFCKMSTYMNKLLSNFGIILWKNVSLFTILNSFMIVKRLGFEVTISKRNWIDVMMSDGANLWLVECCQNMFISIGNVSTFWEWVSISDKCIIGHAVYMEYDCSSFHKCIYSIWNNIFQTLPLFSLFYQNSLCEKSIYQCLESAQVFTPVYMPRPGTAYRQLCGRAPSNCIEHKNPLPKLVWKRMWNSCI